MMVCGWRRANRILDVLLLAVVAVSVGNECPAPDGHHPGQEGLKLVNEKRFAEAGACFWDAADWTEVDEEAVTWLNNAGQAFVEAGMQQEAASAWADHNIVMERLQEEGKGEITVDHVMRVPRLLSEVRLYNQAVLGWEDAARLYPGSDSIRIGWADMYRDMGLKEEEMRQLTILPPTPALEERLREALAEERKKERMAKGSGKQDSGKPKFPGITTPVDVDALISEGLDKLSNGEHDAAETIFKRCLEIPGGDNYVAHYNLGLTYFFTRRWDDAITSYTTSLRYNPTFANSYHGIGNVFEVNRMLPEALQNFKAATSVDPTAADSYFNSGTVLAAMRRHDEAVLEFEHSIRIDPQSAGALINMGVSLKAIGRVQEAVEVYQRAARDGEPRMPQAWGNLATSLHELGRTKEALHAAKKGVELDGNYAHGYNILGTLLRPGRGSGGSSRESVEAYRAALKIAPTFVDASLNLAGVHVEEEEFDQALEVITRARSLDDGDTRLFIEFFNLKRRVADYAGWDSDVARLGEMLEEQMKVCHLHPTPLHPYTPTPQHPAFYTSSPFTLQPAPFTSSPFTLHPAPCTLHPAPCTLHPAP